MQAAAHRIPPSERLAALARLTADRVKAAGGSAMDAALAQIDVQFGPAAIVANRKHRVAKMIELGPDHAMVRARYGARAKELRSRYILDVDAACKRVASQLADEKRLCALLINSLVRRPPLPQIVLSEIRLLLRWLRRYEPQLYRPVLDAASGWPSEPFSVTVGRVQQAAE